MLKITKVQKGGVAHELGIRAGAVILAFDGFTACDILDYMYYNETEHFTMTVSDRGEETDYEVEKSFDEDLGLSFEEEELEPMRCRNKCVFCFIDQMPKGLRQSLYVKDDDYRLSFATGNFVTLTNLSDEDIERIIRLRLNPMYISVHTVNPELRCRMMNNRFAGELYGRLQRLSEGGITMHCQIVLCPGWNDGAELTNTLNALYALYPAVEDVAIVPVGLTRCREGLAELKEVDADLARKTLRTVDEFVRTHPADAPFARCSDEFYVKADIPVPSYESYGDFAMIENGVGMIARFEREAEEELAYVKGERVPSRRVAVVTGESAEKTVRSAISRVRELFPQIEVELHVVQNNFFGRSVTVTGLLTATDILAQCKTDCDYLMLPHCTLKEFEDVFLDGITLQEFCSKIGVPVLVTDGSGDGFVRGLLFSEGEL